MAHVDLPSPPSPPEAPREWYDKVGELVTLAFLLFEKAQLTEEGINALLEALPESERKAAGLPECAAQANLSARQILNRARRATQRADCDHLLVLKP